GGVAYPAPGAISRVIAGQFGVGSDGVAAVTRNPAMMPHMSCVPDDDQVADVDADGTICDVCMFRSAVVSTPLVTDTFCSVVHADPATDRVSAAMSPAQAVNTTACDAGAPWVRADRAVAAFANVVDTPVTDTPAEIPDTNDTAAVMDTA